MTPQQTERFAESITASFNHDELQQLVAFDLGIDLEHVAPRGTSREVVNKLIGWSDRHDRVHDLFAAVFRGRSKNVSVHALATDLYGHSYQPPPARTDFRRELHAVLLNATDGDLRDLLHYEFDVNFDEITFHDSNLSHKAFQIIQWADREQITYSLALAIRKRWPNRVLVSSLLQETPVPAVDLTGRPERFNFQDRSLFHPKDWLYRLGRRLLQVCTIRVTYSDIQKGLSRDYGTGFLITDDLVLTAYHVVRELVSSRGGVTGVKVEVVFDHCLAVGGEAQSPRTVAISDNPVAIASPECDCAVLALKEAVGKDVVEESPRGHIELSKFAPASELHEAVFILQHPGGGDLLFAAGSVMTDNPQDGPNFLRYRANTNSGASGAPVLNSQLQVVAMHHFGDPAGNRGVRGSTIWDRCQSIFRPNANEPARITKYPDIGGQHSVERRVDTKSDAVPPITKTSPPSEEPAQARRGTSLVGLRIWGSAVAVLAIVLGTVVWWPSVGADEGLVIADPKFAHSVIKRHTTLASYVDKLEAEGEKSKVKGQREYVVILCSTKPINAKRSEQEFKVSVAIRWHKIAGYCLRMKGKLIDNESEGRVYLDTAHKVKVPAADAGDHYLFMILVVADTSVLPETDEALRGLIQLEPAPSCPNKKTEHRGLLPNPLLATYRERVLSAVSGRAV